jgi:two-component system sensor histidine kinase YesM
MKYFTAVKKLNIHSLKFKMIITIFFIFIIIVAFSLFYSSMAARIVKEKTNTSVLKTAELTNRYLNFLFKKAKDIGYSLSVNPAVEKLAKKGQASGEGYYDFFTTINDLYKNIIYESEINSEIDAIFVYIGQAEYLITSKYGMYSYENMKDSLWAKVAFNINNNYKWLNKYSDEEFSNTSEIPRNSLLTLIIKSDKINKKIDTPTYVSIHFRIRDILKIMSLIKATPNTAVYFLDNNGRILLADDINIIDKSLYEVLGVDAGDVMNRKTSRIKIDNKNMYQVVFEENDVINGGLLVLIPEKELLEEQNRLKFLVIIMVTIITFFFIYLVLKLVIEYVNKPVMKLVEYMQIAEKGDFESKINEKRKDEFGYLYGSYNQMVDRIKKLIEELYEQKLVRTQMEVKALQKQINPHFLYNTLEIVNWIAKVNNIDSISKIVVSLSNMYRITFNEGRDLIKINDMIYGVKCYMDIQKIRFGEGFTYEINIDPEIEHCYILNLIVQTIVENAVIHGIGIDERSTGGLVKIEGYMEDGDIIFVVEDNGRGMNEEKLRLVIANTNSPNVISDSGLRNVQKRIQLLYGNDYGINIESWYNKGTTVLLKVPVIRKPGIEKQEIEKSELEL